MCAAKKEKETCLYGASRVKGGNKMCKRRFYVMFSVVFLAIVALADVSEAVDMQEGEWETVTEMVVEGITLPPTKSKECITKDDLVPKGEDDKNCMYRDSIHLTLPPLAG